jgi:hypothetical protein
VHQIAHWRQLVELDDLQRSSLPEYMRIIGLPVQCRFLG